MLQNKQRNVLLKPFVQLLVAENLLVKMGSWRCRTIRENKNILGLKFSFITMWIFSVYAEEKWSVLFLSIATHKTFKVTLEKLIIGWL